jgi:hypothetical protein
MSSTAGGAVGDLRRVARGDRAVLLEGGAQRGECLEARVAPDALVGRAQRAVGLDRDDLALEVAPVGRAKG